MLRYDAVEIDLGRAHVTEKGWVRDRPVLTRAGVFKYRRADGTVWREWRPPAEVFHAEHLASLHSIPITVDHPGGGTQMATAANAPVTIGAVLTPGQQHGDELRADVVIHNPRAIGARRQLSLGYQLSHLDVTPGVTPEGEPYDAVQRGLRADHLAIVSVGRAGPTSRLRLDAEDAVLDTPDPEVPPMPDPATVQVRVDSGLSYSVPPEVSAAIDKMRADADAAAGKARDDLAAAIRRADSLEAERDALKAAEVKHGEALALARADAVVEVRTRLALESDAVKHGVEIRADMADRAIREAVVNKLSPNTYRFDGKSDEYVSFAWDHALASAAARTANGAAQAAQAAAPTVRADAASTPSVARSAADVQRALVARGQA